MLREYCELYDKKLEDLTEQEEAQCIYERECTYCESYVLKEYNDEDEILVTIRPEQS